MLGDVELSRRIPRQSADGNVRGIVSQQGASAQDRGRGPLDPHSVWGARSQGAIEETATNKEKTNRIFEISLVGVYFSQGFTKG